MTERARHPLPAPFRVGQRVRFGDRLCRVKAVGMRDGERYYFLRDDYGITTLCQHEQLEDAEP